MKVTLPPEENQVNVTTDVPQIKDIVKDLWEKTNLY